MSYLHQIQWLLTLYQSLCSIRIPVQKPLNITSQCCCFSRNCSEISQIGAISNFQAVFTKFQSLALPHGTLSEHFTEQSLLNRATLTSYTECPRHWDTWAVRRHRSGCGMGHFSLSYSLDLLSDSIVLRYVFQPTKN